MFEEGRRKFMRWEVKKDARIRLMGAEDDWHCQVNDISLKGLQLVSDFALPVDTSVPVQITLDEGITITVEVWVRWEKHFESRRVYGLLFTKIRDTDKEKIHEFLCRHCPEQLHEKWWGGDFVQSEKEREEDRRVFARLPLCLALRFLGTQGGQEGVARTFDVSAKGLGMVTDSALPANTPLELWVKIPQQPEPLYTRGQVVWQKPVAANEYRMGISLERADFMGLPQELNIA